MADKMSEREEKGLRNLMMGSGYDKKLAEQTLMSHPPEYFSDDILDVWLRTKKVTNKERAERVLAAWGKSLPQEEE
jgi:hypothetical protein